VFAQSVYAAPGSYGRAERETYLASVLSAFQETPRDRIENLSQFFGVIERGACRSDDEALRLTCMSEQARRGCASAEKSFRWRCRELSDLLLVNRVNERLFVSPEEKLRLMRKSTGTSYGAAYSLLLTRKYALLATELLLVSDNLCPGSDSTCL